jgi:hypothetical protein
MWHRVVCLTLTDVSEKLPASILRDISVYYTSRNTVFFIVTVVRTSILTHAPKFFLQFFYVSVFHQPPLKELYTRSRDIWGQRRTFSVLYGQSVLKVWLQEFCKMWQVSTATCVSHACYRFVSVWGCILLLTEAPTLQLSLFSWMGRKWITASVTYNKSQDVTRSARRIDHEKWKN